MPQIDYCKTHRAWFAGRCGLCALASEFDEWWSRCPNRSSEPDHVREMARSAYTLGLQQGLKLSDGQPTEGSHPC